MHFREVIRDLAQLITDENSPKHPNYEKQIDTNV